jgi:hypothetical protein
MRVGILLRRTISLSGAPNAALLSICNKKKVEQILAYMLEENEFSSPYGVRSMSRYHLDIRSNSTLIDTQCL